MSTEMDAAAADFFEGPGELRALCRGLDWTATPLGAVQGWSPTLRVAVQMVLGSGLPHVVLWGRELVQVYNDSYAELIRLSVFLRRLPLTVASGNPG